MQFMAFIKISGETRMRNVPIRATNLIEAWRKATSKAYEFDNCRVVAVREVN